MEPTKEQTDAIPESSAAKLAFYFAWIPLVGWMLYMIFAFLGLIQIGRGRTGFYILRNGLVAVFFLSILPIAGLVLWAELPNKYYVVLTNFTRHGCYADSNDQDLITQREFFRFGKSFRLTKFTYYAKGTKKSEETFVGDKPHGKSSRWYENDQLMAETTYEEGKPKGESTYWYENGYPRVKENFVNGKRHGLCSWFAKDGKLERTMNYIDGISQEQIDAAKKAGVKPVIEVDLGGGVKMRMIFIPPGEFTMGSPMDEQGRYWDEGPQHKVIIRPCFYLCETEVTQAQWKAITGENSSRFKDDNKPVGLVDWTKADEVSMMLNAKSNDKFYLPSEAEWEYACRAGTTTRYGFGDSDVDLGDYAWYDNNSGEVLHNVATRKQNNWGLYDMHGNAGEWCEDDWLNGYQIDRTPEKDGQSPPRASKRVCRSGSCHYDIKGCRSAFRNDFHPSDLLDYVGVRFAKTP